MAIDFPDNPVDGQVYSIWTYSSSADAWKVQNASSPIIPVRALVVGGGGGGSAAISWFAGAGGAGGFVDTMVYLAPGTYTCTVGAGGATQGTSPGTGNQGNNSVFATVTAVGGGRGGTDGNPGGIGAQGGSGGGSGWNQGGVAAALGNGQGSAGGRGYSDLTGGGGGAYEAGNQRDISWYRVGGHGRFTDIISTSVATAQSVGEVVNFTPLATNVTFFSGGGAGAGQGTPYQAQGGFGGGGNGGGGYTPTTGDPNTGGGGGAGGNYQGGPGGGSGVVILRVSDRIPLTVSAGLTYVTDTSVSGSVAYIFKSGTGTVTLG